MTVFFLVKWRRSPLTVCALVRMLMRLFRRLSVLLCRGEGDTCCVLQMSFVLCSSISSGKQSRRDDCEDT